MSGHLLTSVVSEKSAYATTRFNPLHVGAPTDIETVFEAFNQFGSFNPLHVGAPTDTGMILQKNAVVFVSIPSMSGHLLTSNKESEMTNFCSFNPLHVGAPTDIPILRLSYTKH